MTCSSDEINNHIKCSYSDPKKDQPLESCKALINPPEPVLRFDLKEPSLTRWRKSSGGREPSQHRDQVEHSENIDQFRIISLLSVESKIFFSIVAKRLTSCWATDTLTSVQKGGIFGVPECIEHTGVVTPLIREARESRGDLMVIWLDLTNAYGSIPHKLVEVALLRYHVPQKVKELLLDYYNKFSLRVSAGTLSSDCTS